MSTSLQELHNNILDYLTKRSRVMFAHRLSAWNDFVPYYDYQYSDYSREALRNEFLQTILPKVFTYNLTDIQKRKIEIFANHYHFRRTEEGFSGLQPKAHHLAIEGKDYVRLETAHQFPKIACIIPPPDAAEEIRQKPRADQKIAAWVSAINSTDSELVCYRLFHNSGLRKRARETLVAYQETGQLPENMEQPVAKKIAGFRNKAETLSSKLSEHFLAGK